MKKQTSISGAPSLQENASARKKQRRSVIGWIIIVLLILVALVPVVSYISHTLQKDHTISDPRFIIADPVDMKSSREFYEESLKASQHISKLNFSGEADFDNSDDGDSEEASTEMVPDSSKMALDGSSEADTNSSKEGNPE